MSRRVPVRPMAEPAPDATPGPSVADPPAAQRTHHAHDPVEKLAHAGKEADEHPDRLFRWVGVVMACAAALWLAGFLFLWTTDRPTTNWNTIWGLSGISFLFAFLPLPGITSALLLGISWSWTLGLLGVGGAAIGSMVASGILLGLGHEGREFLRKKATKSDRARRLLAWSQRAAKKWTYVGVFLLLIPQFIPRAVTLYAAVLAKLRTLPFLVTVLAGTFVRNFVMFVGFHYGIKLFL